MPLNRVKKYRLLITFVGIDILVLVLHVLGGAKIGYFNLDAEGNLASLYAGVKLWGGATLAFLLRGILRTVGAERLSLFLMLALGVILAGIGLDDLTMFHERTTFVLNNMLRTGGFYGESFNWLFYGAPFIAGGALILTLFTKKILREGYRLDAYLFSLGAILWIVAIGTEFFGRFLLLQQTKNIPLYHSLILFEEGFEMVGASLIVFVIWRLFCDALKKHIRIS